ncbi:MAG: ParB N-terminal domain-containing protein [Bacteroidales bacterium]|nr:ParB N-terminal domain-containing protein [Bacteroidales bacterium]
MSKADNKNQIRQSETRQIQRSQIHLNPYNPKRHTDKQVKQQVANIKANGYLGGIVWNEASGNLIDGHRRVQALDIINKYDGTDGTDYTLKVEAVNFDEKTELEQLTYMAVGNSKADYNLIAQYAELIDTTAVGMTDEERTQLLSLVPTTTDAAIVDMGADFITAPVNDLEKPEASFEDIARQREEADHATADTIKAKKQRNADVISNRNADAKCYIMLSFANAEELQTFCEAVGIFVEENMTMNGIELLGKLDL